MLATWSFAVAITNCAGLTTNAFFLAMLCAQEPNTLRQRLREFYYSKHDKKGDQRQEIVVRGCFAPLLRWILSLWHAKSLALALDATTLDSRFVVLAISVIYRGSALPVAWSIVVAGRKGRWKSHWLALLTQLQPAIPSTLEVIVLADRGLYARWLYTKIQKLGWHPFLRISLRAKFLPQGSHKWLWLKTLVRKRGQIYRLEGTAFRTPKSHLPCTLLGCWEAAHTEPWLIITDLAPTAAEPAWYGLRAWIEQGFKGIKRGGWNWHYTRMSDPKRAERMWLVLAVASLWTLSLGGELEAADEKETNEPLPNICTLPFDLNYSPRRLIRIQRLGRLFLLALLVTGKRIPIPHYLIPEPWPCGPPGKPRPSGKRKMTKNKKTYP